VHAGGELRDEVDPRCNTPPSARQVSPEVCPSARAVRHLQYPIADTSARPQAVAQLRQVQTTRHDRRPGASKIPDGNVPPFPPGSTSVVALPVQPTHQLVAPGGAWTRKVSAVEFHTTPQPIVQPCPHPK
jgi:hypothetical protein